MLSFCEECGKRYSFPPEKVEPGSKEFRCRNCGFLMIVNVVPEQDESAPEKQGSGKPVPVAPATEEESLL